MKDLNFFIMAQAIVDECQAAEEEKRESCSSNAIRLFQERMGEERLSDAEAAELFQGVFEEFCRVSGAKVIRICGQDISMN